MGLNRFGFSRNNPHKSSKFGATVSSGTESRFALQFFHLARIVDFLNQLVRLRPECVRNLNLLDSK